MTIYITQSSPSVLAVRGQKHHHSLNPYELALIRKRFSESVHIQLTAFKPLKGTLLAHTHAAAVW